MKQRGKALSLIFIDIVILAVTLCVTVYIEDPKRFFDGYLKEHIIAFLPLLPIWILTSYVEGLFTIRTLRNDGLVISIGRSQGINLFLAFVYFYLFPFSDLTPKTNLIIILIVSSLLLYITRKIFLGIFSSNSFSMKTLIVGSGEDVDEVLTYANSHKHLGYTVSNVKSSQELPANLDEYDTVVVAREYYQNKDVIKKILETSFNGNEVMELSKFCEIITGKIPVESIDSSWFVDNDITTKYKHYNLIKSLIDKLVAVIILLVFLPIFAILVPFLLIFSGRPLFYSQIRTGLNNKPFRIYKLRTMSNDAEKSGAKWATPGDSRVTPIGKFLRVSRLDEIPQIWNIFNGDMSLVGPRPERPEIIEKDLEKNIPHYSYRHFVKPGVTGWAQVNYGYGYSQRDSLIKLQYDLYYVKKRSIVLDIKIILKTVKTVITGVGH